MDQPPTLAEHLWEDIHCKTLLNSMECAVAAPASNPDEMIIIHTLNHAYGTDGAALLAKYLRDKFLAIGVNPNPRIKPETQTPFAARVLHNDLLLPRKTSLHLLASANIPHQ